MRLFGFQAALVLFHLDGKASENFIALKGGVYDEANSKIFDLTPQGNYYISLEAVLLAQNLCVLLKLYFFSFQ